MHSLRKAVDKALARKAAARELALAAAAELESREPELPEPVEEPERGEEPPTVKAAAPEPAAKQQNQNQNHLNQWRQ